MKLPHPFIQLPLQFDAARLAAEVAAINEASWRPHPQNFPGNSMLPLVAVRGDPLNEAFSGVMEPTSHLAAMPYLRQAMAAVGATVGRTRLMRLDGNAEVTLHADQGYYWGERVRVHVPIVTRPDVQFICGGAEVNMGPGECWIFDTWRLHRVQNGPDVRRIHLVIDTVGGSRFWQLVDAGRPHPSSGDLASWVPKQVSFEPGKSPDLPLEVANVPVVMTPWEIETRMNFLLAETPPHPNLDQLKSLAGGLARDWRGLWAQYGASEAGKPEFRARRDAFVMAARPLAAPVFLTNELNLYNAILAGLCAVMIGEDSPVQGRAKAADRG